MISQPLSVNHQHPIISYSSLFKDLKINSIAAMPAYNEENQIAKTIISAKRYVDLVVVVDDGSTDNTSEIAEELGALVYRHEKNNGYGAALNSIFNIARELGTDSLVILDADGQHDPKDIPFLLEKLDDGADIVIGSRFLNKKNNIPGYRKIGMKMLDAVTNFASDLNVSDSQSGYRAYGRKAIWMIQILSEDMSAGSEILSQIKQNGLKIEEVPIFVSYELENTSTHHPVKHGIDVMNRILDLISIKKPMFLFGSIGLIMTCISLIFGFMAYSQYLNTLIFPFATTILSVLLLITGLLISTTGLILHSIGRIFLYNSECYKRT
jgi:glycosyltransferase involved in cell wall biosynthesis